MNSMRSQYTLALMRKLAARKDINNLDLLCFFLYLLAPDPKKFLRCVKDLSK